MKRILILILALATMLALAAPVGAAKGGKPGKPGTSGPVDVTLEANMGSVHAVGDTIYYTITVTSSEATDGAVVELFVDGATVERFVVSLGAGSSLDLDYFYTVATLPDGYLDASVTVLVDGVAIASATTTVGFWVIDECGFEEVEGLLTMTHPGGDCRYDFAPGYWEMVAYPDRNIARRYPVVTMRDDVPGNWCTVGDAVKQGGSITRYVDLPAQNPFGYGDWWEVGVCGFGGQGMCTDAECFFPTGNPATFALTAPEGTVTAERLGDAPPNP
jgi:hypothetical protein